MEVIWEPHSSIQVIIWGARNCQVTLNILPYACELCMIIIEIFYDIKIWFGNFVFSNYILYDDTIFTYNTDLLFTYTYGIFTIHKYILIHYSLLTYTYSILLFKTYFTIHKYCTLLFIRNYYSSPMYTYAIILFTYTDRILLFTYIHTILYYSLIHTNLLFTIHVYI